MVRVIVVDDEELVRSGFRLILRAAGDIEVVATVTGAQAVEEVSLHRPDVVPLDIRCSRRSTPTSTSRRRCGRARPGSC
ncbi:response regulator [Lentzea sp. BCCO 10_0061]|uniref:Response regulator n=1 Tax=Lentzea sokolovensis TaxID=3095429 RepID=A0ABU4V6Y2_9PSEU|nr:response regulator [Lentzea sp. BCCO 10_0061]MDX8147547.1 response regulator [Lentzea sp. BCCO 10_0061]